MSTPRFFAERDNKQAYILGEEVTVGLSAGALHHANRVLRLRCGQSVEIVLRDLWTTYRAEITYLSNKGMVVKLIEKLTAANLPISFDLYRGFAKHGKNDQIVRQAVEIGCDRLTPVIFERSILRVDQEVEQKRVQRLQAIAESAAMQAHREIIPPVEIAQSFEVMIENLKDYDGVVVAWEQTRQDTLSNILDEVIETRPTKIALVIGPEGGITDEEIDTLVTIDAQVASMGTTILRVETACCVACGITADRIRANLSDSTAVTGSCVDKTIELKVP